MSAPADILNLAMQLPEKERAALAHELLVSLESDHLDEDEVTSVWQSDIDHRLMKIAAGTCKTHDWREAIEEVRQELKVGRLPKSNVWCRNFDQT
jgi:hypothetical protein